MKKMDIPEFGLSLRLPVGYAVRKNGEYSRLITKKAVNESAGPSNFLYISVIPKQKDVPEGEIYNYSKREYDLMLRSEPGKKVSLGSTANQNLAAHFEYTRIPDRMIGGYGALSLQNTIPWGMPAGTSEYRYIVQFGNVTYLIGGYVGAKGNADLYITTEEFNRIIGSVTLKPTEVNLSL